MLSLKFGWQQPEHFAAGVLFGTAGIRLLTSKDAKKAYTHATAAVLRAKDCVLDEAAKLQENCSDIYAEAKEINEVREAEEIFEDGMEVEDAADQAADEA